MTNLSVDEKIALEEVFIVLHTRRRKRVELLRRYLCFYSKVLEFIPLKGITKKGE